MTPARVLDDANKLGSQDSSVTGFDFQLRTRIVFGNDSIEQLGELARSLKAKRVLVVSDPGIVRAGHVAHGIAALEASQLAVELFDGAHENPTTDDVARGLEIARDYKPDLLIGLGGGSSMDCAKGINFLYSCGGRMSDYWGVNKATGPMLPMIAVPTTGGTGSEMQSFALISDATTHVKMACGDKRASCTIAVLDPKLTLTQPREVTALTGVDALSHALETYVTKPRNAISCLYSRESWRLLASNFRRVLSDPNDLEARAGMQLGAAYAGIAIENSMLGAAHALANPLTAKYGISHGQAVGAMLPHVIRYNGERVDNWYRDLNDVGSNGVPKSGSASKQSASHEVADFVQELLAAAGLKTRLQACGVQREQLHELAESASIQWTGGFNPRKVDTAALLNLYENAY